MSQWTSDIAATVCWRRSLHDLIDVETKYGGRNKSDVTATLGRVNEPRCPPSLH